MCLVCALGIYILFSDQFKLTKEELNTWTSRSEGLTKGLGITQSKNYVNHTRNVNTRKLKKMLIRNPTSKKKCYKETTQCINYWSAKVWNGCFISISLF